MYKIKECPEDFIVKEVSELELRDSGEYLVLSLKKKNYTTLRAIEQIAKSLGVKVKDIGFAGIKDKNAVTEQYISVKNVNKGAVSEVRLKDISLKFVGYLDKPISLGDLEGNEFIITVRDFNGDIKKDRIMPNFFGEQRFSKNNVEIGRELLKSEFEKAFNLIISTDSDYSSNMKGYLKDHANDFVGALKLIPKKLLQLYVHAYQSYLWNRCLEGYAKKNRENVKIPLIGFGTEIEDKEIEKIVEKVMAKERVTFRSFINRSIPDISLEGELRDAFVEIKEFKVLEKGKDFVKIKFRLVKGSYGTVAVGFLFRGK